jgi:uncharacterized protein with ParB-like and HNH nuclease domain
MSENNVNIQGDAKNVRTLLHSVKYSIDYYQREYKWQTKQIQELIDDLSGRFLEEYQPGQERHKVAEYGHYFLGSIIISKKDGGAYVVDGQQRLTSLTLLLIFLRNLQNELDTLVAVDELILSIKFGQKSFNLNVEERAPAMEALYNGEIIDLTEQPESVQNLVRRYQDIGQAFPDELKEDALPYFIDWLLEKVFLVEITAFSDDDAYTIFETMNDRGLSLSPTDMLKGYLLANIPEGTKRNAANLKWKSKIGELNELGKDVESDFFKAWLRSQHSLKIRERKRGAKAEDFDRIGTEFHRWLKDSSADLGLNSGDEFYRFLNDNFDFYSRQYLRLIKASREMVLGLEHVLYNSQNGFTLQYMLLLAPVTPADTDEVAVLKQRLVARFIDILLAWRIYNFRSIAYSTMQYAMFVVMRDIRGLGPEELARKLTEKLADESETFSSNSYYHRPGIGFTLHQQNRYAIHRMLARMTDFVERESGLAGRYSEYVAGGKNPYEVEHIWADKPDRHQDEFPDPRDFREHRNRFGDLLLLPKNFNASFGALPYEQKLAQYNGQNMLARSLHPLAYENNPGFLSFVARTGLPFKPHERFKKEDLDERSELYRQLAENVWNANDILAEVE